MIWFPRTLIFWIDFEDSLVYLLSLFFVILTNPSGLFDSLFNFLKSSFQILAYLVTQFWSFINDFSSERFLRLLFFFFSFDLFL